MMNQEGSYTRNRHSQKGLEASSGTGYPRTDIRASNVPLQLGSPPTTVLTKTPAIIKEDLDDSTLAVGKLPIIRKSSVMTSARHA